jgi:succinate dehydrogenase / fumarate reductase cytochrome b subunit
MAIFGFLCLHILDVSTYAISRSTYDDLHELYGSAPMRLFESGLLFAILFHTLNGLRILAIDVGDLGQVTARRLLVPVVALTLAVGTAGTAVIMAPVLA